MKVTQNLDLMKTISREQLSYSRDMGFVNSFRLQSVLESTKKRTKNEKSKDYCKADLRQRVLFFITSNS